MHMVPTSVNIESFAVADLHSEILDACPLPSAIFFIFMQFSAFFLQNNKLVPSPF